ncbi:hypothetical protein HXX76_007692 [Chlamydomonas incerta]|uniref:Uncharacterized protein n=1 Tax=Chlamydomonas incerta TaxID=51695 RepID=A0A835T0G5_CHLIN|nr:hypothetical protein HXX76_007692 [Chlamydomonas incerta]|eukprot:KAG2434807.1 hypothetical protein HXX76_007692 [Chlamydomonas incerta]
MRRLELAALWLLITLAMAFVLQGPSYPEMLGWVSMFEFAQQLTALLELAQIMVGGPLIIRWLSGPVLASGAVRALTGPQGGSSPPHL